MASSKLTSSSNPGNTIVKSIAIKLSIPPSLSTTLVGNSLHILCFGDSLTAGFYQGGAMYHPYAGALKESLEKALPLDITTDVQGAPGDQITTPPGNYLTRMDTLYEEVDPKNPYNIAIILGGTNDIAVNRLPAPVFSCLQEVWAIPLSHNTIVLSLTVPECGDCLPIHDERREEFNKMILDHEEENFYTWDFNKKIPYWAMSEDERKEIWDDNVHLTAKGYDLMGSMIAERIVEIIEGGNGNEAKTTLKAEL